MDGLRGLSALLVLVYHVPGTALRAGLAPSISGVGAAGHQGPVGEFAVALFFLLSGYLIVERLRADPRPLRFLRNRARRIYPAFLPIHCALFLVGPWVGFRWMQAIHPGEWLAHFISNLLFLPGFFTLPIAQQNAWSLSYEAGFYLVAALGAAGALARGRGAPRSAMANLLAGVVWTLAASIMAALLVRRPDTSFFVLGAAMQRASSSVARRLRGPRWLDAAALAASYPLYCLHPYVALPAVALALSSVMRQDGWLGELLRARWLRYTGEVSYSLYLLHPFVLRPLATLLARGAVDLGHEAAFFVLYALLGVAASLLAAVVSFRWLETRLARVMFGQ